MTTASADFRLNDSPQSDAGYIATAGGTVDLELEDGLAIDAGVVKVTLERASKNATDIPELATEYILSPPSATLTLTIPDEISSWLIRVQLNGGSSARGLELTWTRERIIATVGETGVRKIIAGETVQFDATDGWCSAQNDEVDAIEEVATLLPGTGQLAGLDVTSELRADVGVEHGYRVARWVDQRGDVDCERVDLATSQRPRPRFRDDYGDGFAAIQFDTVVGVALLVADVPLVTSEVFSLALYVRFPAATVTALAVTPAFAGGDPDACKLILGATFSGAGADTSITASLTDDTASTPVVADATATHSAWHTVVVRSTGAVISVRVDGANGSTEDTSGLGASSTFDVTGIGALINPEDGSPIGDFDGGVLRHILAAQRAWTDAECLTVEAAMRSAWE